MKNVKVTSAHSKPASAKSDTSVMASPQVTEETGAMIPPPGLPPTPDSSLPSSPDQTPILRAIVIGVGETHGATRAVGAELVVNAAKCGLLLLAAKAAVGHGEFESWFEKQKFGFTKVTRCKYMRLATRLCQDAKSKPDVFLKICAPETGKPASFVFSDALLKSIVSKVCLHRTLSDLYADWEIQKPPTAGAGETKLNVDDQTKIKDITSKAFGALLSFVADMPTVFQRLKPENQAELVSKLEALLVTLKNAPQSKSI